jgi:hypothetical protein
VSEVKIMLDDGSTWVSVVPVQGHGARDVLRAARDAVAMFRGSIYRDPEAVDAYLAGPPEPPELFDVRADKHFRLWRWSKTKQRWLPANRRWEHL